MHHQSVTIPADLMLGWADDNLIQIDKGVT